MPKAAVVWGSKSNEAVGADIVSQLSEIGVECEYWTLSAHKNHEELDTLANWNGAEVFSAVAGLSATLPGVMAKTARHIIGVPRGVRLGRLDSLLYLVQMPPEIPVATGEIENWKNAALLAIDVLSLRHPDLEGKLRDAGGVK